MLKMWRERKGSEATDEKLVYALSTMPQCKEIQEKVKKVLGGAEKGTGGLIAKEKTEKKSR